MAKRLDIPAIRLQMAERVEELNRELFALAGAVDIGVVTLKRYELTQREERRAIRERGWQLNELERQRELRRMAREMKERAKKEMVR